MTILVILTHPLHLHSYLYNAKLGRLTGILVHTCQTVVDPNHHPTCILISVKNRYQVETIIQGPHLFPYLLVETLPSRILLCDRSTEQAETKIQGPHNFPPDISYPSLLHTAL